jgi:endonuclease YncB( thermonuclease family)
VLSVDGYDANREQVRAGMAWWYRQYAKEQTPADRQLYEVAENNARAAKRGLWVDNEPVLKRPVALPITPEDDNCSSYKRRIP